MLDNLFTTTDTEQDAAMSFLTPDSMLAITLLIAHLGLSEKQ